MKLVEEVVLAILAIACTIALWGFLRQAGYLPGATTTELIATVVITAGLVYVGFALGYRRFLLPAIRPRSYVGGRWIFAGADAKGNRTIYGMFDAAHTYRGGEIMYGSCWDARFRDIEIAGKLAGKFLENESIDDLRLVWWMIRFTKAGTGEEGGGTHEPYSGVATVQRRGPKGNPLIFGGPYRHAEGSGHGDGRIVFALASLAGDPLMPEELRGLSVAN